MIRTKIVTASTCSSHDVGLVQIGSYSLPSEIIIEMLTAIIVIILSQFVNYHACFELHYQDLLYFDTIISVSQDIMFRISKISTCIASVNFKYRHVILLIF